MRSVFGRWVKNEKCLRKMSKEWEMKWELLYDRIKVKFVALTFFSILFHLFHFVFVETLFDFWNSAAYWDLALILIGNLFYSVIKSIDSWLCIHEENVAVVHCKVRLFICLSTFYQLKRLQFLYELDWYLHKIISSTCIWNSSTVCIIDIFTLMSAYELVDSII